MIYVFSSNCTRKFVFKFVSLFLKFISFANKIFSYITVNIPNLLVQYCASSYLFPLTILLHYNKNKKKSLYSCGKDTSAKRIMSNFD